MRWDRTRTGFLVDGRLHSLSSVWDFLRFPPLDLFDKLRLGLDDLARLARERLAAARTNSGRRLAVGDIRAGERWSASGCRCLKAKLGDAWQRTSAAFIWATIQRMYAARHSGHKHEMFGYLPGGYARMLGALADRLRLLGRGNSHLLPSVTSVERNSAGEFEIGTAGGDLLTFDRVAVTTPARSPRSFVPN